MVTFQAELEELINRRNKESESNTPDFILATYLSQCLAAFNEAVKARAVWYGRMDKPGKGSIPTERQVENDLTVLGVEDLPFTEKPFDDHSELY